MAASGLGEAEDSSGVTTLVKSLVYPGIFVALEK